LKKDELRAVIYTFLTLSLIFIVAGGIWFQLGRGMPVYSSELKAERLKDSVKIVRDQYGVPHIYASSLGDAFFAQGYCQAQDRLWEMDLSRRAVSGRLSQIFGESMVSTDKFFLTLGLYEAARISYPTYGAEAKSYAESFAAGVNRYIDEAGKNLPPEFSLLGYRPEKWDPVDSVAIGKYMAYTLGGNTTAELLYMNMAQKVSEDKLAEILPDYPAGGLTILREPTPSGVGRLPVNSPAADPELLRSILALPGEGVGSNNWVLGGSMTRSGKPLLCNDMHLEIKSPSIWYQNHLVVEGQMNVTGVMFPGAPGVVSGHNDHIAWGLTNVNPDVQDLYLEKRNPDNPYQFQYRGQWEDARVVKYDIQVKGSRTVPFEVVYTRHGPLIGQVYPEAGGRDLALQWTAHLPTRELEAVLGFDTSRNWQDFKAALENFKVPAQNFVFADVDGNIAYQANGLIPVRKKGSGLLPAPGWTGEYDWTGFIPWDELPQSVNPPEGFIVTANNKITGDHYPHFITWQWAAPYRALSIRQSFEGKKGLTLEDALGPQSDWSNLQAKRLYPVLAESLSAADLSPVEKKARDTLLKWAKDNPRDNPQEAGPAIYHTLYLEMVSETYRDELGNNLYGFLLQGRNASIINNNFDNAIVSKKSLWFDNVNTPGCETAGDMVQSAFKKTVSRLQKDYGINVTGWKWGRLHTVTIDHPMGKMAALRPFFDDGPYPYGGSNVTSGAASYEYRTPFAVTSAGPWRYGVDLSGMSGKDILAGGISGHPNSEHYRDQTQLWLRGEFKELLFDNHKILEDGENITVLQP